MHKTEIFRFSDYRSFLSSYAETRRRDRPGWSYGRWAKDLGLKGTASLTMVVQGQRRPGPRLVRSLVQYFRFSGAEQRYFAGLVELEKVAKDPAAVLQVMDELRQIHPSKDFKIVDAKVFSAVSHWYCYALREMTRLRDFRPDPAWIRGRLRFDVSSSELREAIRNLLELNLLKRDAEGRLTADDGRIDTANDIADEGIKRFHEQMLGLATAALRSVPPIEREITASTLTVETCDLAEAKAFIREWKRTFASRFERSGGDATYQLNIQFIPLTKPVKDQGRSLT